MIKRSSGVLLHISSLPSAYGIGTLGRAAYEFADFLSAAGQSFWQMLPVGPTSYGDSPYQSFSTFAGNPYFVDLDLLREEGLLTGDELSLDWGDDPARVDYGKIYESRFEVLRLASDRAWEREREKIEAFAAENAAWLPDYALFMALKRHFGMLPWYDWPDKAIRLRRPGAVKKYRALLREDVRLFEFIQYKFSSQWDSLREYLREKGIGVIGDMPIYVAMDSCDVWASPRNFLLDKENLPTEVAGVPPDYFSEDGQLWGNPLYDWEALRREGYAWWTERVRGAARLYDALRIDHFRGLESFWAVPYGETTAKKGRWVKGPGLEFVEKLKAELPALEFIAEDLGFMTEEVRELLQASGFPGMKVLGFAFSAAEESDYLPHKYERNCVCYVGTHDNATIASWLRDMNNTDRALLRDYLGLTDHESWVWGVLRAGLGSVANLFVAQMQDLLELGGEARMNTPGTLGMNWQWRLLPGQASPELAGKMRRLAEIFGRKTGGDE